MRSEPTNRLSRHDPLSSAAASRIATGAFGIWAAFDVARTLPPLFVAVTRQDRRCPRSAFAILYWFWAARAIGLPSRNQTQAYRGVRGAAQSPVEQASVAPRMRRPVIPGTALRTGAGGGPSVILPCAEPVLPTRSVTLTVAVYAPWRSNVCWTAAPVSVLP